MPQDVARYRAGDVVVNVNVPGEVTAGIVQQDSTAPRSLRSLNVPPGFVGTAVALAGTLLTVIVVFLLVGLVVRYVAETALIAMVDHKEKSGQRVSFTQGWRWGWSPAAWRLFLIDLLVAIVVMAAFLVLALVVALPLLAAARTGNVSAIVITAFSAGGLFFVLIFLGIVAGIVLSLLKPFFRRACVLEGLGVTAAIRQGTGIVRRHLKDAGLMWLIMLAIDLLWPLLLAPVALLLVAVALIVGGLTGTTFGAISALLTTGLTPWLIGVLAGVSIFLAVLVAPLVFLGGLREVYQSTSWTLTYNELSALEKAQPVTRPKEALSGA